MSGYRRAIQMNSQYIVFSDGLLEYPFQYALPLTNEVFVLICSGRRPGSMMLELYNDGVFIRENRLCPTILTAVLADTVVRLSARQLARTLIKRWCF